jgi:ubiquinone/menaquinone biosynthesis C-methylase UbiE
MGTVLDEEKRTLILNEARRVLKPGGSIFLIENNVNSEFEYYRGRHLNNKTQEYNNWLLNYGFKIFQEVEINISFDNINLAQYVFQEIWKERLFELPKNKKIKNKVIVFELKIDNI